MKEWLVSAWDVGFHKVATRNELNRKTVCGPKTEIAREIVEMSKCLERALLFQGMAIMVVLPERGGVRRVGVKTSDVL